MIRGRVLRLGRSRFRACHRKRGRGLHGDELAGDGESSRCRFDDEAIRQRRELDLERGDRNGVCRDRRDQERSATHEPHDDGLRPRRQLLASARFATTKKQGSLGPR
jgi:hypothetical protein